METTTTTLRSSRMGTLSFDWYFYEDYDLGHDWGLKKVENTYIVGQRSNIMRKSTCQPPTKTRKRAGSNLLSIFLSMDTPEHYFVVGCQQLANSSKLVLLSSLPFTVQHTVCDAEGQGNSFSTVQNGADGHFLCRNRNHCTVDVDTTMRNSIYPVT